MQQRRDFSLGLDQLVRRAQLAFELGDPVTQPGQLGPGAVRLRATRGPIGQTLQRPLVALVAPVGDQLRVQALPPADLAHGARLTVALAWSISVKMSSLYCAGHVRFARRTSVSSAVIVVMISHLLRPNRCGYSIKQPPSDR